MTNSKVLFTADTHFQHANILIYAKRPFANTEEMDEAIIYRWNLVVKPEDEVFIHPNSAHGALLRLVERP